MGFATHQWREIQNLVAKMVSDKGEYFIRDIVIGTDPELFVIYTREFGDTPVQIASFGYEVKYYMRKADGSLEKKTSEANIQLPERGERVLIAKQLGSDRLPVCLGVVHGIVRT